MKRIVLAFLVFVVTYASPFLSAEQFKKPVYYKLGDQQKADQVISAPFTHSGNLDLAVANYLTNEVSILLGNGDGTFQKALTFPVSAPTAIAVGDLNQDGNQDLVVIEYGGTGNSTLGIFLGDGTGHFRKNVAYLLGVQSVQIAVDDFNHDGHQDIAVTNKGLND